MEFDSIQTRKHGFQLASMNSIFFLSTCLTNGETQNTSSEFIYFKCDDRLVRELRARVRDTMKQYPRVLYSESIFLIHSDDL
ncbi:hypothetical protein EAH72_28030 [Pseudomonas caspiana]|nr:hypothetical protein EAH72_28030 [Pseudomonas caspiana]